MRSPWLQRSIGGLNVTRSTPLTERIRIRIDSASRFSHVMHVFARHMPREQAKHATRKYLASL